MASIQSPTHQHHLPPSLTEPWPTFFTSITTALLLWIVYTSSRPKATMLLVVSPSGVFELTAACVKKEWLMKACDIIQHGCQAFPGCPFNMIAADVGLMTILPPEYANEIRNNLDLSFVVFMSHVCIELDACQWCLTILLDILLTR